MTPISLTEGSYMKALRWLLQIIILSAGGVALAVLMFSPAADLKAILFVSGFVVFLLALTFLLKEHTEKRRPPNHALSPKPIGMVFLMLGAFGIFYGATFIAGGESLPDGSGSCRAICGLIMLASVALGDSFARLVACFFWAGTGLVFCVIGFSLMRTKAA